jgi:polysaccharide export outer membrane protein
MGQKFIRCALLLGSTAIFAGCTIVPGMYMGSSQRDAKSQTANGAPPAVAMADGTVVEFVPLNTQAIAEQSKATPVRGVAASEDAPYAYHIGVGDVLRVTVWDHPEFNNPGLGGQQAGAAATTLGIAVATASTDPLGKVVTENGTVYLPYVGSVRVAGMTVPQVRTLLATRLGQYIKDPQLDVYVSSYRSQRIYVTGEVVRQGVTTIGDIPVTVADLISSSGGLTPLADYYHATITRKGKSIPVNLYALLNQGDLSQNYRLRSGDVLNIPDNRFNKVFVLGEVTKPQSLPIPKGDYSLSEALADSGGVSQLTANAAQIYVLRRGVDNVIKAYVLDSDAPSGLVLADSFRLQPRDVVFVDAAGVSRFSRVVTQLTPFLSGASSGAIAAHYSTGSN